MALIARLFGSKAELWDAMVDHLADLQVEHLQPLLALVQDQQLAPAQALSGMIEVLVTVGQDLPEFGALLLHEATSQSERAETLRQRLVLPFRDACLPVLMRAAEAGLVRTEHPRLLFGLLLAALTQPVAVLQSCFDRKLLPGELRDILIRQANDLLLPDRDDGP